MQAAVWAAVKSSAKLVAITNGVGFVATAITQSHKVTDLTGTAAFAASAWATHLAAARLAATRGHALSPVAPLLTGAVTLWAARLGGYLFYRVLHVGKDARLDQFFQGPDEPLLRGPSVYPLKLAFFWTMQGLWAWVCMLPVTAAHAVAGSGAAAGAGWPWAAAGLAVFAAGFALESIADGQKFAFKSDPANEGRFMQGGLFTYCRHPNYFGEMCVWVGLSLAAGPAVWRASPWVLASPLFTVMLLRYGSGVPPLEASYERRYGSNPEWQAYKASTNLLLPWPPRQKPA